MKRFTFTLLVVIMALAAFAAKIEYSLELEQRAMLGDQQAMWQLANCYRMGWGIAKDLERADYWTDLAAQNGNENAIRTRNIVESPLSDSRRAQLDKEYELKLAQLMGQDSAQPAKPAESAKPAAPPTGDRTFTAGGVQFKMIMVEGGTFTQGGNYQEYIIELPQHQVTLSSYYIGETEVTQELWKAVMGVSANKSWFKGSRHPVGNVTWEDAQEFIRRLNDMTGQQFRLPTEAEWEFAARGGNKSRGYTYSGSNDVDDVAWYLNNSDETTHDVATKKANELGIYDMSGNVREWCSDWYSENYYASAPSNNPLGPSYGSERVSRGGDCINDLIFCWVAFRDGKAPHERLAIQGLRLAM